MALPAQNVLANLFATIQNAEMRALKECIAVPASRLAGEVLRVMQREGYIGEFEFIDDGRGGKLRVQLLGRINRCGVVSPRYSSGAREYGVWERRYLPAAGMGILLVSTPKGVMSHREAQERGLGGVLLGYVY
jgi:small subunit ribosomal protein S8